MKREVVQIFDDLEALLNFCRLNMAPFNEADLYNKGSKVWRDYEYSKRPRNYERKEYLGNKPRNNNGGYNNNYRNGRQ
jgi:hypothetical protein